MAFYGTLVLAALMLVGTGSAKDDWKFKIFDKCRKEANLSESAIEPLFDFVSTEGIKNNKCMAKCILEEAGIFKEDKIDMEKWESVLKNDWKKPEDHIKIITPARECLSKEKKLPDACEYSFNIVDCFVNGIRKVRPEAKPITYKGS